MLDTILASYGCSYLLLGYLELMDAVSDYVDKKLDESSEKRRQELERAIKDINKLLNDLEQAKKQIKELEK